MKRADLETSRRAIIREIRAKYAGKLWESGYVQTLERTPDGKQIPIRIYAFKRPLKIRGMFHLEEIEGFIEDGVVTEFWMGMLSLLYSQVCIEDLMRLRDWLEKNGLPAAK